MISDPKSFLVRLFRSSLAAVNPRRTVLAHLPPRPKGRLIVLGGGKGAGAMAAGVEDQYGGGIEGLIVTRDGYRLPMRHIEVVEASHPVPDVRGAAAAERMLQIARSAEADDLVLCLISGGASALLVAPAEGLSFEEKQAINRQLLRSGAAIDEMNCVRKHLSRIKGGRLAEACFPAKVLSLIVSDVVGDDVSVIASGPTAADPTTCADALAVLGKYGIAVSDLIRRNLQSGVWETPKVLNANIENKIVSRPRDAFKAAHTALKEAGLAYIDLGDALADDADKLAALHADRVRRIVSGKDNVKLPCVILSGGEGVVRVKGGGRGGPNTEFALHLARELQGMPNVFALACDSDGTDGNGDHAGAVVAPDTLARAATKGLDPALFLAANDTAGFFTALGDAVITGPTFTNVNDFRAVLIF